MVQLCDAVGHSELREFVPIRAEGIGLDYLSARFDVRLMDAKHGFRVRRIELVNAALRADCFVEERAHRPVGDEDGLFEALVEIFNSHGWPGDPFGGEAG
jgi:hypothetical protein